MSTVLNSLSDKLISFIEAQKVFFVATAMAEGTINLSPKGMDTFRVMGPNRILWLNLTGSGNETAAHLKHHDRMTIMFCAFDGKPLILRLYGHAKVYHERDGFWKRHINKFPKLAGSRQLIDMEISTVQTSCGMAVPILEFKEERELLKIWAEKKKPGDFPKYYKQKNSISLDGHPTDILEDDN